MKTINTFIIITFLMLTASISLYSQKNISDISGIHKYSAMIKGISKPMGVKNINSLQKDLRETKSYKQLENGYVLESVDYQLFTGSGWLDYQSEFNTYDGNFNLIETVTQFFNGASLENYERIINTYTLNDKPESKLVQYWNGSVWEDDTKTMFNYDIQGRYSVINYLLPDGVGGFVDHTRELFSYESNPKKEIIEAQFLAEGEWVNLSLTEAGYLDEERVQDIIISGWNGFEYELSEKFEYSYTNGMMTLASNLVWSGSEWNEIAKQSYTYDVQDRLTEYISLNYNGATQSWENVYRMMNTYFGNDSLITIAQSGNVNDWENLFKTINHFNQDGNLDLVTLYSWDSSNWVADAMGEYDYDENGNLKLLVESVYEDDEWSVLGRAIYGYIPTNTTDVDVDDLAVTEYKLYDNYPNPFNPSTVIRYHLASESTVSVKVYDITGSEVAELINQVQTAGTHNINFNASGMASGVYVYKVSAISIDGINSFSDVKKMMLMK